MSRLRDESGFSLPELLTAMAIFTFVLGATLDVFDGFVARSATNTKINEAQEQARSTMDGIARQVRNLASPTNANVKSIELATDYDLVYQTVDPGKRRVRYCLDYSNPANSRLWMQTQAFPVSGADPGLPSTASCPVAPGGGGWASKKVAASRVVNRYAGQDRNVFYYTGLGGDGDTAKITGIRSELFVDVNPGKSPAETSIATGDFLRNQNQQPVVPDFSLVQSPAGSRHFILNGSEASDPEGRTLEYRWYTGTGNVANLPTCASAATQTGGGFTCLGQGLTLNYTYAPTVHGVQSITLKVIDPGGLSNALTKSTPALP